MAATLLGYLFDMLNKISTNTPTPLRFCHNQLAEIGTETDIVRTDKTRNLPLNLGDECQPICRLEADLKNISPPIRLPETLHGLHQGLDARDICKCGLPDSHLGSMPCIVQTACKKMSHDP